MSMTIVGTYEEWLTHVKNELQSINMAFDDWQNIWPFAFRSEYESGTAPSDTAEKANRFWWYEQNKSQKRECLQTLNCWLPRGHEGKCQPVS